MDAKTLGNTPAFPCGADGGCGPWPGMTLRQWYAGLVIAQNVHDYSLDEAATLAVRYADALLAELAKENA